MFRLLILWILSAAGLMFVSRLVPGFYVDSMWTAMLAAALVGFLNATLGFALKLITSPLAIVTFGVFLVVINATMIMLASHVVGGFDVYGWTPAFWGAAVMSLLSLIIRVAMKD
ncbi:MAG: phage holin family protein [Terracidiphilus sp.]